MGFQKPSTLCRRRRRHWRPKEDVIRSRSQNHFQEGLEPILADLLSSQHLEKVTPQLTFYSKVPWNGWGIYEGNDNVSSPCPFGKIFSLVTEDKHGKGSLSTSRQVSEQKEEENKSRCIFMMNMVWTARHGGDKLLERAFSNWAD